MSDTVTASRDRQNSDAADLRVEPVNGPFDIAGWPPAEPAEPSSEEGAQGRAPAAIAQGPRDAGSLSKTQPRSGWVDTWPEATAIADGGHALAPATAGAGACGRPNGLPSAGASDIAPAPRYPRCGGDLTSTVAARGDVQFARAVRMLGGMR